jgi:6-phosphogluconolactonase
MEVHGDWPRNFTIDPSGKFLLVANKKSDNISVFKIDLKTGMLSFLNSKKVPTPVCLLF